MLKPCGPARARVRGCGFLRLVRGPEVGMLGLDGSVMRRERSREAGIAGSLLGKAGPAFGQMAGHQDATGAELEYYIREGGKQINEVPSTQSDAKKAVPSGMELIFSDQVWKKWMEMLK